MNTPQSTIQNPKFPPDPQLAGIRNPIQRTAQINVVQANAVIDLSHHNIVFSLHEAAADGIAGVLHKATQGTGFKDPAYASLRARSAIVKLLWGAYHFGTGDDPARQASFFLETANPDGQTLLALDFETNPDGPTMSISQAEAFVTLIRERTGKWPGFYSSNLVKDVLGAAKSQVLANCWLWLAEYGDTPRVQASWQTWTLWQYTDGVIGPEPHTVKGVGPCDRDTFNGDIVSLRSFWAQNAA